LKIKDTKVILCANSKPAINDITYAELLFVIKKAALLNETLNEAYNVTQNLILIETGSGSPCLVYIIYFKINKFKLFSSALVQSKNKGHVSFKC
jgi:hypothetical protein